MPKLKGPLFSLTAQGPLAKLLTFRRRGSETVVGIPTTHPDAKSAAQLSWRTMYEACSALWHTLSSAEKQAWETNAKSKHMTGFALWQSQCLRPNPGIYLPLAGGTMQGDILMASHKITGLPVPTLDPDAATKAYVDAAAGGADYPMKLKPALTRYVLPGWYASAFTIFSPTIGRIYYTPIFVTETTTFDRIAIYVNTFSAGTADLRIFNWTAGLPSSLLLNAGSVDTGTTGAKEIVIAQQLTRGYYFLAVRLTAAPLLRSLDKDYAVAPPVPGLHTTAEPRPDSIILYADAPYADPAPPPTAITNPNYASVFLRET